MKQVKRALTLFASQTATRTQRHHNVRQYLKALEYLGNSWILSQPVARKTAQKAS